MYMMHGRIQFAAQLRVLRISESAANISGLATRSMSIQPIIDMRLTKTAISLWPLRSRSWFLSYREEFVWPLTSPVVRVG